MNSFPYMPLYWNDMIADNKVRVMSNGELGAYIRLLAAAWQEAAPGTLPADEETLARLAGVRPAAWRRLRTRVLACFSWNERASRYEQKRMMQEYAALAERNDRRSDAGVKAAAARWNKAPCETASPRTDPADRSERSDRSDVSDKSDAPAPTEPHASGMPPHADRNASALRSECLSESNSDSPSHIHSPRSAGMTKPECRMTISPNDCEDLSNLRKEEELSFSASPRDDPPDSSFVIRHSSFLHPASDSEVPTESQALANAATAGVIPDFAKMIYADWSARGGRDGAGVLVPWARYLAKRWAREGPDWKAGTHRLQTNNRSSLNHSNHGNSAKSQRPAPKSECDRDRDRTGLQSTAGEALRRL